MPTDSPRNQDASVPTSPADRSQSRNPATRCRVRASRMHVCRAMVTISGAPARLIASVAVTLVMGGLVAGCSSSDEGAAPATSTAPASSSGPTTTQPVTTTSAAVEQQVIADYRAFWDAYLTAADPMDPFHPGLAQHATGEELRQLEASFAERFQRGEAIRGTFELAPRVVSVNGPAATISDCYGDSTQVFDADGNALTPSGEGRYLVTVSLVLEDGTWKVSAIKREADGCTRS